MMKGLPRCVILTAVLVSQLNYTAKTVSACLVILWCLKVFAACILSVT